MRRLGKITYHDAERVCTSCGSARRAFWVSFWWSLATVLFLLLLLRVG